jgi:hypothetical protein
LVIEQKKRNATKLVLLIILITKLAALTPDDFGIVANADTRKRNNPFFILVLFFINLIYVTL